MGNAVVRRRGAAGRPDGLGRQELAAQATHRLLLACSTGDLRAAKRAVASGGDVGFETQSGRTALYDACSAGNLALVEWLCKFVPGAVGALMIADRELGWTPFHVTCANGHVSVAKWLYENVPQVRGVVGRPDRFGWTPLVISCWGGRKAVSNFLVHHVPESRVIGEAPHAKVDSFHSQCMETMRWIYNNVPQAQEVLSHAPLSDPSIALTGAGSCSSSSMSWATTSPAASSFTASAFNSPRSHLFSSVKTPLGLTQTAEGRARKARGRILQWMLQLPELSTMLPATDPWTRAALRRHLVDSGIMAAPEILEAAWTKEKILMWRLGTHGIRAIELTRSASDEERTLVLRKQQAFAASLSCTSSRRSSV